MYRLNDLASLWQGWVEGGEGSPSTKLSSCNSGQSGQEASQRETWDRRIEDRNYFRFIDEPIILHLWRSCLKFYFEFVCSQFSSIFFFVSDFFFFFPRLGEHIFHSLIKPYIFGWDNVFLHFWDDSVLSILSRSFWIKSNLFIYLWDSLIIFLSGNNFLIHLQKRSEKREFQ